MTRPPHLRAGLISATLVVLAVAAWLLLAPTQIGGETSYVTTSGISMQPRFHSGDLAVVRPAGRLPRRGHRRLPQQAAAPRRPAPHHRDQGRSLRHSRATTTTSSIPTAPRRADVVGKLAVRVRARRPRPALAAHALHGRAAVRRHGAAALHGRQAAAPAPRSPPAARGARRRQPSRPDRRATATTDLRRPTSRPSSPPARWSLSSSSPSARSPSRVPASKPVRRRRRPTPRRSASATTPRRPPGRSTPTASSSTGDPIFLKLVHRVRVKAHYRLATKAPQSLGGTMEVAPSPRQPDRLEPHHPARRSQGLHRRLRQRRRDARRARPAVA